MSRTISSPKGNPSTHQKPLNSPYKLFIWDLGTDSRQPWESTIRTLAVVEFSSHCRKLAHFSTSVRPNNVNTTKNPTPTFPDAWNSFSSFIVEHSHNQPPLLVSHNSAFDVTVLLTELRRANIKIPSKWRFACSLLFSRSVYPFTSHNSQLALAVKLGVPVNRPHHTPEDVIVLRQILIALDQSAIQEKKPLNRVVPALCVQARKPAFFDRTPQPSATPDTDASPKFFISQTGTRYHRQGCKWLRRSNIPRNTPPPGFEPCRLCRPDDKNYVIPDKLSTKQENGGQISRKTAPGRTAKFFVTRSGTKYHVEGCKWLSKSKIPKDSPPQGLEACGTCIKDGYKQQVVQEEYNSKSLLTKTSEVKSSEKAGLYITKTGSKYHVKGCKSLGRSQIPITAAPAGYEACGICLPNVAYKGSPKVKKIEA